MPVKKILAGVLVGVYCFLAPNGWAVTLQPMSLAELVQEADIIFVGTAVTRVSAWNPEHTRIYTRTTFQLEEYLKGYAGETIVVETMGGVAEGVGMMVPGMPVFSVNQQELLFVTTGRRTGTHHVLGWVQGRFQIRKDPKTGRETVSRNLAGVSIVGARTSKVESIQYLDELKEAIHRLKGK